MVIKYKSKSSFIIYRLQKYQIKKIVPEFRHLKYPIENNIRSFLYLIYQYFGISPYLVCATLGNASC